jgi:hypothetical protein
MPDRPIDARSGYKRREKNQTNNDSDEDFPSLSRQFILRQPAVLRVKATGEHGLPAFARLAGLISFLSGLLSMHSGADDVSEA